MLFIIHKLTALQNTLKPLTLLINNKYIVLSVKGFHFYPYNKRFISKTNVLQNDNLLLCVSNYKRLGPRRRQQRYLPRITQVNNPVKFSHCDS